MRNPERIRPFLRALEAVWMQHPDQRFGQLVMNLSREPGGFADTWNWENGQWLRRMDAYLAADPYPSSLIEQAREAATRTPDDDQRLAALAALDSLASLVAEREAELAHFVSAVESIEKVCVNEPDAVTAATRAADIARGVLALYSPETTGAA